ncbi:hypothetical protein Ddye_000044 [Dipteronia dyeriana]|uniref:Uncharacterized protein n=1 Tax=Dipteronia dyeriana TaxID=168575 RepID=A0AAD9XL31_9ROSI|nr:hypothetical protein Ddye_000044 [Dipteronia dyeriana]
MSPSLRSQSPGFPVRVRLHSICPAQSQTTSYDGLCDDRSSSGTTRPAATNDRRLVAVAVVRKVATRIQKDTKSFTSVLLREATPRSVFFPAWTPFRMATGKGRE